jgi:hypothetical protein
MDWLPVRNDVFAETALFESGEGVSLSLDEDLNNAVGSV